MTHALARHARKPRSVQAPRGGPEVVGISFVIGIRRMQVEFVSPLRLDVRRLALVRGHGA